MVIHSLAQLQALYVGASDAREGGATVRTRIYDDLGAVPWPAYADGRALKNRFAELHVRGVPEQARAPTAAARQRIHSNAFTGKQGHTAWHAVLWVQRSAGMLRFYSGRW